MKSESVSSKPAANKWRLKRTLRRSVAYRPIEEDDMKFLWAAYKKGALETMGMSEGMFPDEFKTAFQIAIVQGGYGCWVIMATTNKGFLPIGVVIAKWPWNGAPYMIVNGMCWFPWSSGRNKLEGMVNFLNGIRKQFPLRFYALPEHKRMYEVCAQHAVIRRVGTSYLVVPGQAAAEFETITPKTDMARAA